METLTDVLIESVGEYCVDIGILDDSVVEGKQSFSVTLDSTDDYVVYTTDVPVIIQDNDCMLLACMGLDGSIIFILQVIKAWETVSLGTRLG